MHEQYTQADRRLQIATPLGADALLLIRLEGEEAFNTPSRFTLEMLSQQESIDPAQIVGQNVTCAVHDADDQPRFFNGYVARFGYCGTNDRLHLYRAEIVPWLWFLGKRSNCRIFQQKTIPQIVQEVFEDAGFRDFDASGLTEAYPSLEYCVQYRETDLAFVSRLLERAGVFYYIHHQNGKHTVVLGDDTSAYKPARESRVDLASTLSGIQLTDQIYRWEHHYTFYSGKLAHTDYNFKDPRRDLRSTVSSPLPIPHAASYELFDYPGGYDDRAAGDRLANQRIEREEADYEIVFAQSMCRTFGPGLTFTMARHHNPAESNRSYVVRSIKHIAELPGAYVSGAETGKLDYQNEFECMPDAAVFRPAHHTPLPAAGPQTARVVGPDGEEIYTDEFGRVKVKFHWDRYSKGDENSSCWIRVSQPWAGAGWGGIMIPRIGEEVLVGFEEGDPDRPLITGRVYNAVQKVPYDLPANKTVSTIKTRSSQEGDATNFNEIKLDDKKGHELFYVQAEKDRQVLVKNNNTETVNAEETISVGANRSKSVAENETTSIGANRTETVGADESITIAANRTESVGANETITIAANRTESVGANETVTIAANQTNTVGANNSNQIGANQVNLIGQFRTSTIGLIDNVNAGLIQNTNAGLVISINAGVQITLKAPGGTISIKPDGIDIDGKKVTINGKKIDIEASGKATVKGSPVHINP